MRGMILELMKMEGRFMTWEFASKKLVFAFAVLALAGWLATPAWANGQGDKIYKATLTSPSPATVSAETETSYTITIGNCQDTNSGDPLTFCFGFPSGKSAGLGAADIFIPSGFTNVSLTSVIATGDHKKGQGTEPNVWHGHLDSINGIIQLRAGSVDENGDHVASGVNKLDAGETVSVTFKATAPAVTCDTSVVYTWATRGSQNPADTIPLTAWIYLAFGDDPKVTVQGPACGFTGFNAGDYCTYTQGGWGAPNPAGNNPAQQLVVNFGAVYPSGVEVGIPGAGGYSMIFNSVAAIRAYLPGGGTASALTQDYINPTRTPPPNPTTPGGVFGGQVLALQLNVDFNTASKLASNLSNFSSVKLVNTGTSLDTKTIAQILASANTALGGSSLPSGFTYSSLSDLITNLNEAFDNCNPSLWTNGDATHPHHLQP